MYGGRSMKIKVAVFGLIVTMFTLISSHADDGSRYKVESAADTLYNLSSTMPGRMDENRDSDIHACHSNDTATVTIYSTNGMAQSEIDVKLDGSSVGSLKTYYPDGEPGCKTPSARGVMPGCKTPSARGVITIKLPAGKHTLEADSPNISWPSHNFSVKKCECMVLPLS